MPGSIRFHGTDDATRSATPAGPGSDHRRSPALT
jgi:hypothetical protein